MVATRADVGEPEKRAASDLLFNRQVPVVYAGNFKLVVRIERQEGLSWERSRVRGRLWRWKRIDCVSVRVAEVARSRSQTHLGNEGRAIRVDVVEYAA